VHEEACTLQKHANNATAQRAKKRGKQAEQQQRKRNWLGARGSVHPTDTTQTTRKHYMARKRQHTIYPPLRHNIYTLYTKIEPFSTCAVWTPNR
jgi:hypothetical protein